MILLRRLRLRPPKDRRTGEGKRSFGLFPPGKNRVVSREVSPLNSAVSDHDGRSSQGEQADTLTGRSAAGFTWLNALLEVADRDFASLKRRHLLPGDQVRSKTQPELNIPRQRGSSVNGRMCRDWTNRVVDGHGRNGIVVALGHHFKR